VLKRISGPKGDEVTEDWRHLHNEKLHNLYSSPNAIRMIKSRRMRWAGHRAHGEMRNLCKMSFDKPDGKRPLKRPRRRWDDNIKVDLRGIRFEVWIGCICSIKDGKFLG
jgi:hypothetical protein